MGEDSEQLRQCSKCEERKTLDHFRKRRTSADGVHRICIECLAADCRNYRVVNREKVLAQKKAYRRSEEGKKKFEEYRKVWYEKNRDQQAEQQRNNRLQIKLAVLRHYGPTCTCCGERDSRLLTIEHSNGDGARHRVEVFGTKRGGGAGIYRWLLDNGLPGNLGLTVLCTGCNQASHHNKGTCPHSDVNDEKFLTTDSLEDSARRISWLEDQLNLERKRYSATMRAVGANTTQS